MINGYVIEHSRCLLSPSPTDIVELESKISSLCSRLVVPVPVRPSCGGFRTTYEPLARVHMLWLVSPFVLHLKHMRTSANNNGLAVA